MQAVTLAGAGCSIGDTSIILNSFSDIDGNALAMTDFGTIGFGTIEPNASSQEEQISFTGITVNANGTVTLTGISHVAFVSPYTQTSGVQKTHPGGAKFIISNTAGFYDKLTSKSDDETIDGVWTFSQSPIVPTGGSGTQAANHNDIANAITGFTGTATTSTAGTVKLSTPAVVASNPIVVGDNDTRVSPVSLASLTASTVAAWAGTSGTPSSSNKYVTNDDTSTTGESGKVVRASGTSLPALDGSSLTGVVNSVILTAGQNIAQNDVVAIGDATNVKTGSNVSGATGDSTISGTTWFSQKITTTVSAVAIKQIGIKMSGNGSGGTLTVSLRADDGSGKPTGSDLGVGTVSYSTTEATYVVTFSSSIAVSPSTFYHIIVRLDVGGGGRFITRDNTAGTGTNKSTDSGSTWSANNGPLVYDVYEEDTALNKIYKACSLFNSGRANGFIGFAKAAITSGNTGTVVVSGIAANTGLTSGATYYLSDTPGAVSASAGTVSRKIGKALSTTSILIKHDNP